MYIILNNDQTARLKGLWKLQNMIEGGNVGEEDFVRQLINLSIGERWNKLHASFSDLVEAYAAADLSEQDAIKKILNLS